MTEKRFSAMLAAMEKKNPAAAALGRLGKGIPKTLTQAERKRRRERLAAARAKRWPDKAAE